MMSPGPETPRRIGDDDITEVVRRTLEETRLTPPLEPAVHGPRLRPCPSTIHRIWRAFGLQPHRSETFKLSSDPLFVDKVRDIVGLYLAPPERALVLCVDEKKPDPALERTQPVCPCDRGKRSDARTTTHATGTTTLFAALDVATGSVIGQCLPRHRSQEFLSFLRTIEGNVPSDLDLHLVMDNYATHKTQAVQRFLPFIHAGTSISHRPGPPG